MPPEYDWHADAIGCYNVCIAEMKKRMAETGEIPPALIGTGPHSERLRQEKQNMMNSPVCPHGKSWNQCFHCQQMISAQAQAQMGQFLKESLIEESKLRGVRNAESGKFAEQLPDLDHDCCPGCGSTIPDAHLRDDCVELSKMSSTKALLAEREKTHGVFEDNARIAQHLRAFYRRQPGWDCLTEVEREAFDMDAIKAARILSGGNDRLDAWRDRAGYAELSVTHLSREMK